LAAVLPLQPSKAGEPSPIHRAAAREVARHPLVLRLKVGRGLWLLAGWINGNLDLILAIAAAVRCQGCHRGWVKLLLRCFPCICCVGNFLSQGESTSRVIDPEILVADLSLGFAYREIISNLDKLPVLWRSIQVRESIWSLLG